jgi:leader peptidase (prepilin peptidase) / N-methyltransferase
MRVPEALLAALFGLLIGSFLNVCIYRLPRDLSVVRPRSACPACHTPIAAYDNIPVLSWLLLRGRCRHCGGPISWRYPAVELITGAFFFLGVLALGPTLAALRFCVFTAIQIVLIFTDLTDRILPDEFTLGGAIVGMAFAWFVPIPANLIGFFLPEDTSARVVSLAESASGSVLLAGLLWSIGALYFRIRGREGLGFGDVKMVACIGAFLGLGPALLTVALGSVLGSVFGLLYIRLAGKDAAAYELPFGSFLGVASLMIAVRAGPLEGWLGPL